MQNQVIAVSDQSIRRELFRKSIHISIAAVPFLATIHFISTVLLLTGGIIVYTVNELSRINGKSGGIISLITNVASRPAETGFVWGPVTLGIGAMAALIYFPVPISTVSIFALAFGDGIASLAGQIRHVPQTGRKTMAGSSACFFAVLISSYSVFREPGLAFFTALSATLLEAIPVKDIDNLIIPIGTGFLLTALFKISTTTF